MKGASGTPPARAETSQGAQRRADTTSYPGVSCLPSLPLRVRRSPATKQRRSHPFWPSTRMWVVGNQEAFLKPSPVSARTISSAILFPRRPIGPMLSSNLFRSPGPPSEVAGPREESGSFRQESSAPRARGSGPPPCRARNFRVGALDLSLRERPCCWSEQME